jgi:hypothetical protein
MVASHIVRASTNARKASNPMFFMRKTLENTGELNGFVKDIYPARRVSDFDDMTGGLNP